MARFGASKGVDFSVARLVNMRADWDGILRLSSKNEMANPALDRFDADGSLGGHIRLLPTPAPIGRGIYLAGSRGRPTRQNQQAWPRSRSIYAQAVPIVSGSPLPTIEPSVGNPRPRPPGAEAVDLGVSGYAAADYGVAFLGGIGDPKNRRRRRLTNPGPFTWFRLEEGQYYHLDLPQDVPEGQTILGIVKTAPNGTEASATIQELIDVSRYVPREWPMRGPLRTEDRAPVANETFVGAPLRWGPPGVLKRRDHEWRTLEWVACNVAWQFRTKAGWGAAQPGRHVTHRYRERGAAYFVYPGSVPFEATAWRPIVQTPSGTWLFIDFGLRGGVEGGLPLNYAAYFHTDDPEKWPNGTEPVNGERSDDDETGIRAPEQEPEAPRIMGNARIIPDRYQALVTDVYPDGSESAPSAPRYKTVGAGQYLELRLAESAFAGNVLPNAMLLERRKDGQPALWTRSAAAGVAMGSPERGVWDVNDSSGGVGVSDLAYAEVPVTPGQSRVVARAVIEYASRTGGSLQVVGRFVDDQGGNLGTFVVANGATDAGATGELSFGAGADGSDFAVPAGATRLRYLIRSNGSVTPRNFRARVKFMGVFHGLVAPSLYGVPPGRTGLNDDRMPVRHDVDDGTAYPTGGYCVAVENPPWANGMGNGIEFYAPMRTPLRQQRGPVGAMTPLEMGELYSFSAHVDVKGTLGLGVQVLNFAVKLASGRIHQNLGPVLATNADASGRFRLPAFVSPHQPSYLEITHNLLGQGRVRVWGWQLERGAEVTAWTDDHAPEGTATIDFDTRLAGAPPTSPLGFLGSLERWVAGGATADAPAGTAVTRRFRSKWDPARPWTADDRYHEDLRTLPRKRVVQVEVRASTSNPNESPEISELFIEGLRSEPTLSRADGREYFGGVSVKKWSAPQWGANADRTRGQTGGAGFREKWPALFEMRDVELECWYDETATAVSRDSTRGERLFRMDTPEATFVLRILNVTWKTERDGYALIDGKRVYRHTATIPVLDVVSVQSNAEEDLPVNDAGLLAGDPTA